MSNNKASSGKKLEKKDYNKSSTNNPSSASKLKKKKPNTSTQDVKQPNMSGSNKLEKKPVDVKDKAKDKAKDDIKDKVKGQVKDQAIKAGLNYGDPSGTASEAYDVSKQVQSNKKKNVDSKKTDNKNLDDKDKEKQKEEEKKAKKEARKQKKKDQKQAAMGNPVTRARDHAIDYFKDNVGLNDKSGSDELGESHNNDAGNKAIEKASPAMVAPAAVDAGAQFAKEKAKEKVGQTVQTVGDAVNNSFLGKAANTVSKGWNSLKSGVSAAGNGIKSAASFVGNGIKSGANAVANGVSSFASSAWTGISSTASFVGSSVAGAFGFGSGATAFAATGSQVAAGALVISLTFGIPTAFVANNMRSDNIARVNGLIEDCDENLNAASSENLANMNAREVDMMKRANAEKIYSVFHALGYSNENIAGILGNWDLESGIDSTSVEGLGGVEQYAIGPKKREAFADLDKYTQTVVFANYRRSGVAFAQEAYKLPNGTYAPGFGLGQITGGARSQGFTDTAKAMNRDWWDFDWQLAYIIAKDVQHEWLKEFKDKKHSTPEDAAYDFRINWEGNSANGMSESKSNAAKWFARINDMSADSTYANSILNLAEQTGGAAFDKAASRELDDCITSKNYDNSSIVNAALSLSWPSIEQSTGNLGTPLYRKIKELVMPGDTQTSMDCGRGVCTIVRWGGGDDDFPYGPTSRHYEYMMGSDKWDLVGEAGKAHRDGKLRPGDVVVKPGEGGSGHILMYIGSEILDQHFASESGYQPGSEIVHASLDTRSLGAGWWYDGLDDGQFYAFRLVKPETNSKWKGMGGSGNLD